MAKTLEELKRLNDRLTNLLADPQEGLFTWNDFMAEVLSGIAQYAPNKPILDGIPFKAKYKNRKPDPGVCQIIEINWVNRLVSMTNGCDIYFPFFSEIELV